MINNDKTLQSATPAAAALHFIAFAGFGRQKKC